MRINSEEVSLAKDMDTLGVVQLLVEPKKKKKTFIHLSHRRLEKAGVGTGGFQNKNLYNKYKFICNIQPNIGFQTVFPPPSRPPIHLTIQLAKNHLIQ